jgi:hypothetical protein
MPKTYNRVDKMAIIQQNVEHLSAKIDEINCHYHDFNKLHLSINELGCLIRVNYINDDDIASPLTDWLPRELIQIYLENYQRMFCLDPNRLDRFFDIDDATIIKPICCLRPTRKRPNGIANGFIYMRQAYQGIIAKRKPISVRPNVEGKGLFDIMDGNSTYHVAKQIGMKSLPVAFL